jgi:PAS domain S-box-containing protein
MINNYYNLILKIIFARAKALIFEVDESSFKKLLIPLYDELQQELKKRQDELEHHNEPETRSAVRKEQTSLQVTLIEEDPSKIAETEQKIANAIFETQEAVVVLNANKAIIRSNQAFSRITGFSSEEACRLSFLNSKQHKTKLYKMIWERVNREGYCQDETLEKHKNGQALPIAFSISAILDHNGIVNYYVVAFRDILKRKQQEVRLQQLNSSFNAFLEHTSDLVYSHDKLNRFIFCSNSVARLANINHWRDLIGKTLFDVFPAEMATIYSGSNADVFKLGEPIIDRIEPYHDETGNIGWLSTSKWPQFGESGEVEGVLGISRNITNQKVLEDDLKLSEARYRSVVEDQTDIICRFLSDGTILYVNDAFCRFFGKSREELIGFTWHPRAWHEDIDLITEQLNTLSPSKPIVVVENRVINAAGAIRWCHFINRGFFNDEGKMIEMQAVGRDITERRLAEESQRIAAVAFETQEGIIIADVHKTMLKVNNAFTRMTGFSDQEAIGETPHILCSGIHDNEFYQDMWASIKHKGFWKGEIWDKRKNGEIFPVWQTITAVHDNNGAITHYVGVLTDITIQKQAEKVLFEARERLKNEVANSAEELEKIKIETMEVNSALKVLLRERENELSVSQSDILVKVETTVFPMLEKLKKASANPSKTSRYIQLLETELKHLINSYARSNRLNSVYLLLTPIERKVAQMVRQGETSKTIASTLNLSSTTVDVHRKHIRKKLNLSRTNNLYSYLLSLPE